MATTGFPLSLLLLLCSQTLALKTCDNCLPVADCLRWCTKLQMGLSNLTLDERALFNDNICGYVFNADPPVKMCCDDPAEKDACKKDPSLQEQPSLISKLCLGGSLERCINDKEEGCGALEHL